MLLPSPKPLRQRRLLFLSVISCGIAGVLPLQAQSVPTVRDNEFRSRWADYQVDRPQTTADPTAGNTGTSSEQTGLLSAFARSFFDLFRTGPLQVRANLASGWEYSNEAIVTNAKSSSTDNSFFASPGIALFYSHESGPLTISARYSAGYVYYFDQSYVAANHHGGILSQTAALDLKAAGVRSDLTSSASASYGDGDDIESGAQRTLLSLSETLSASYIVSTFTSVGLTGGVSYSSYSGGGVADIDTLTDTAAIYIEYAYSPKTRGRIEIDAGQQLQSSDGTGGVYGNSSADRWYYQALLSGDYLPTPKLTLSAGIGYGVQNDSNILGQGHSGAHPIYRITVNYAPTPKTTASFRFGYEGVDVAPSLQLQVGWQFRLTTSANLSIYQTNNFSTYEVDQNLVTRGILASVQQRFFGRVDVALSAGVEQSEGYGRLTANQAPVNEDPYGFVGVSLLWELNSYLAFQGYYRGFTGGEGAVTGQKGLQSRAAVSLRLTF